MKSEEAPTAAPPAHALPSTRPAFITLNDLEKITVKCRKGAEKGTGEHVAEYKRVQSGPREQQAGVGREHRCPSFGEYYAGNNKSYLQ